jgi:lipoprotein-releasing system permease protein
VVRDVAVAYGGGVSISDWTRQHANFFRSIQLTRSIVFMILLLVVAVAAFNIVSTLVMVVRDKRAEIAILRTLGAAPSSVLALFMGQGIIIGVLGTVIGVLAGVLLAWNISPIAAGIESLLGFRFLAADVYFISELPSRLLWSDVLRIASIALGLSLISTLYPAWRAAVTAPAEVLRHE